MFFRRISTKLYVQAEVKHRIYFMRPETESVISYRSFITLVLFRQHQCSEYIIINNNYHIFIRSGAPAEILFHQILPLKYYIYKETLHGIPGMGSNRSISGCVTMLEMQKRLWLLHSQKYMSMSHCLTQEKGAYTPTNVCHVQQFAPFYYQSRNQLLLEKTVT